MKIVISLEMMYTSLQYSFRYAVSISSSLLNVHVIAVYVLKFNFHSLLECLVLRDKMFYHVTFSCLYILMFDLYNDY